MGEKDDKQAAVPSEGPASQAGVPQGANPNIGEGELREQDVTAHDRIDEGDLSESERLPGDE